MTIDSLNDQFGIDHQLRFVKGQNDLTMIQITSDLAKATLSTYAAQVLSFQPHEEPEDVFFVSDAAYYSFGKAIRGGVPICWPWFGNDPTNQGKPSHGFARKRAWQVKETQVLEDGSISVKLSLTNSVETEKLWPHRIELLLEVIVSKALTLRLITSNNNQYPITISQALHAYFKVGDISKVQILGLEGTEYIDQLHADKLKTQGGSVAVEAEVDRIYTHVPNELVIDDKSLGRRIKIDTEGSQTAVVWNPWIDKAARMTDLGDQEYRTMICVETANAGPELITIPAGESYQMTATYSVKR
ncbi:MAG: D-hexose-6-phosphate mutarotase [Methylococcaceae bacterium]